MRFSRRTNWNTEESDLARAHRQRIEAGLATADLTASNPTRCGFHFPGQLLDALRDERALDYDPQPRGLEAARKAVCGYYAGHGVAIEPAQVVLTTSTSEAYSFLFRLLLDAGDEILVPQPGYPLFDFLATLDDIRIRTASLVYDYGWQLDFESLRQSITDRTRAIVLVHPNNPTGHFTKPWESEQLRQLCLEHSLSLIVDEVFLDYSHGEPAESFARGLEGVPVFVVSGMSKIAGLPQMKAAWIVATGPEKDAALERLEVVADTFLSMNAPVQWALGRWLELSVDLQQQILERVKGKLEILDEALAAMPLVERLKVEGGWYAVLRIPALEPDEQTVTELLADGVWVHPGYFFAMPAKGWLVVSLLGERDDFRRGVALLKARQWVRQSGSHNAK